jgi:1-deoxy-D-xylulose-5-phosphate synthase
MALLDSIQSPADLRKFSDTQLEQLCVEIRAELLRIVAARGGHLASNLGTVELTVAMLAVFDPPTDKLLFDVGHQAYAYKLLTGRRQQMERLRQDDGCSGFQLREESPCDAFGAGHAGTAVSAALGMAAARDHHGGTERIVAIVGDGALGCGSTLEGLNSVVEISRDFLVVVNDNKMSIGPNVGALGRHLNKVISHHSYYRARNRFRDGIEAIPLIGPKLRRCLGGIYLAIKNLVLPPGRIFQEMGFRYLGPIDGHNLKELLRTFRNIREVRDTPLLLHVLTHKGMGYLPAEKNPEAFHGVGCFDPNTGNIPASGETTFSSAFGTSLGQLLGENPETIVITAGTCSGTGLLKVREKFPERYFDVGIAEEHAVIFAAGLAAQGMVPIVAIYATFMQRALDYVFHDVCLQRLPVVFCLDRAGIVDDGPTHHGIHELAFWRTVPNLSVLQPADATELDNMLRLAVSRRQPVVIRYPKGEASALPVPQRTPLEWGRAELLREGADVVIWASGRETATALDVAGRLATQGIEAAVVNPRFLIPFDRNLLRLQAATRPVVTLENHVLAGGLADIAREALQGISTSRLLCRGWPIDLVSFGTERHQRECHRLTPEALAEDIIAFLR